MHQDDIDIMEVDLADTMLRNTGLGIFDDLIHALHGRMGSDIFST
jgi:hypothetical protein